METLEWIAEAKKWCGITGRVHSWHWAVNEGVDSDQFPALEGQSLLSDTTLEPSDSNELILHPCLSTQLPDFIILPPPTYCCEYTNIFPFFLIYLSLYYFSDIFSPAII